MGKRVIVGVAFYEKNNLFVDENFSKILITQYNTARPAVMSDVFFRNKMFSILDVPPLDFLTKIDHYIYGE